MELITIATVEDILYTDNGKGPYKQSKVGKKYDFRRNRLYKIYMTNGGWLAFLEIDEDGGFTGFVIETTDFVEKYIDNDGYFYLETVNSIYKCKLKEEDNWFGRIREIGADRRRIKGND